MTPGLSSLSILIMSCFNSNGDIWHSIFQLAEHHPPHAAASCFLEAGNKDSLRMAFLYWGCLLPFFNTLRAYIDFSITFSMN